MVRGELRKFDSAMSTGWPCWKKLLPFLTASVFSTGLLSQAASSFATTVAILCFSVRNFLLKTFIHTEAIVRYAKESTPFSMPCLTEFHAGLLVAGRRSCSTR